ncbi:hypothetical protein, partial [Corynebacterium variabile]|uniref:hypothetical protein n=1 Tax=Corynebacterium variabile TaxID=1727 RepID=UPI003FD5C684
MTSFSSPLLAQIKTRASLWLPIILSTLLAIALIAESSSALAVAQGEQNQQVQEDADAEAAEQLDITDTADARQFAVDMLESNFPASRDAAAAALAGSEDDFKAYKDGGRETAQNQDLRQILVTISAISGPKVQDRVNELLEANDGAGDTEAIAKFIDAGWQELQAQDDRATAWQAAEAPRGTALKRAADAALKDNSADALAEFAATGADTARTHDKRREVYELSTSELPSVAAGAQEALQVNTDTAIDTFLRYGQFVAASQDTEKMNTSQLVNLAITEANKASEANSLAVQQADSAARASENARRAAQRARDEAIAADGAQVRAGNAATAAGELANQAARVADQAVAASQEARIALQQTADALARAAAAASQARAAAATAAARASDASRNAGDARAARIAAEQANSAAHAADMSEQAYKHADTAARHAGNAGAAASAAAGNAEAAAAAASEAAGAAGVSESAAAEARAGAARARAAAGRARAAANQVDQLVVRIQDLVNKAREAAKQAAEHARRSAKAAEESAQYAGDAEYAARMSGKHAADAATAAKAADEAIDVAEAANEISRAVADDRAAAEKDFLRGGAEDARAVQDSLDATALDDEQRRKELAQKLDELGVDGPGAQAPRDDLDGQADSGNGDEQTSEAVREETPDPSDFDGDINLLREATVAAALVGGPTVAGAAQLALESGRDDDLKMFALSGYPAAVSADESQLLRDWAENDPNEYIQAESDGYANSLPEDVHRFIAEEAPELRIPELRQATWQLRETSGAKTVAAADDALRLGTYDALNEFVNGGGYEKSRWSDQVQEAYHLVETGGPELKAAAEAAVVGDRSGLDEFINIEQYRRAAMDDQRASHDANIESMLSVGRRVADVAGELAANAQAAHENALGSAARARQYADAAAEYAGYAQESARMANEHLASAQQSLDFAKAQQARAHRAAESAEADANQAEANASQATSHAVDARASANAAASSAASARASADAAGQDAALAAQAADDAYQAAVAKDLAEQAELQAARHADLVEGQAPESDEDLLSMLKRVVGPAVIDTVLEFLGVNDLRRCFGGSISSCLMAAVSIPGIGKVFKLGKLAGAVRQLVGKMGDVRDAMRARKTHKASQVDKANNVPSCPVFRGASYNIRPDKNGSAQFWSASSHYSQGLTFRQIKVRCTHKSTAEQKYRGGPYKRMNTKFFDRSVKIERHHIVSKSVIIDRPGKIPAGQGWRDGPSIQMDVADHRKTLSHGHLGKKAREYRAMQFDEINNGNIDKVFQIEYDFIKS